MPKPEKLFIITRYYLAPISVLFSFLFMQYVTMFVLGMILLVAFLGYFEYKPNVEDKRNYIAAFIFICLSIPLSYIYPRSPIVLICNLIIVLVFIYLTGLIKKKNKWENPFKK